MGVVKRLAQSHAGGYLAGALQALTESRASIEAEPARDNL